MVRTIYSLLILFCLASCTTVRNNVATLKADDDAKSVSVVDPGNVPDVAIRDLMIFNHFDPAKLTGRTIGIEAELGGVPPEKAIEVLVAELGGEFVGEITHGTEKAFLIRNTSIGDVRIEPVNLMRILNRINQTNPNAITNQDFLKSAAETAAKAIDSQVGTFEIVLAPLDYESVKRFAPVLDKLGLAGAKGTSNFGRLVSLQVNIGIDHRDGRLIKNLLRNYYSNKDAFRGDISPALMRRMYLGSIKDEFIEKLNDPNWHPDIKELYDWYIKYSPPKLARLNLFNALINSAENFERMEQAKDGAKERIGRPVAEFREANIYMSDLSDPKRASRHLMYEVEWGLSHVFAAEADIVIDHKSEVQRASESLAKFYEPELNEGREYDRFVERVEGYVGEQRKNSGAEFLNSRLLQTTGIAVGSVRELMEGLKASGRGANGYLERLNSQLLPSDQAQELNVKIGNSKKAGTAVLKLEQGRNAESVYKEYINGEILSALGIASDRILAVAPSTDGPAKVDSVKKVPGRGMLAGDMRNWSKAQTFEGLALLREMGEFESGRKMTNTTYTLYEISKTAKTAARLQHHFIMIDRNQQSRSGLYPGGVSSSQTRFLSLPDPNATTAESSTTFSRQAGELKSMMKSRIAQLAKSDPKLNNIKMDAIFDRQFAEEIGVLTLQRLGIKRSLAVKLYARERQKVDTYVDKVWKVQFNRLQTDVNAALLEISRKYASRSERRQNAAQDVVTASSDASRKNLKSRNNFLRTIKNLAANRNTSASASEMQILLDGGSELLELARSVNKTNFDAFGKEIVAGAEFYYSLELPEALAVQNSAKNLAGLPAAKVAQSTPEVTPEKLDAINQTTSKLGLQSCDRIESVGVSLGL